MAIAKKPKSNQTASKKAAPDVAAEKFISAAEAPRDESPQEERKKVPTMVRFDRDLLRRVDAAAKHRGISRSSWIQFTISRALDQGEG
jgi:predicted HicB family RNase H-like nuclease